MYTQQEFDRQNRSKSIQTVKGVLASLLFFAVMFGAVIWFSHRLDSAFGWYATIIKMVLLTGAVGIGFVYPLVLLEQHLKKYDLVCPHCGQVLNHSNRQYVQQTKLCAKCKKQAIKSEHSRKPAVYARWQQMFSKKMAYVGVVCFAILSLFSLPFPFFLSARPIDDLVIVLAPASIGFVGGVYAAYRTGERRFLFAAAIALPALSISIAALVHGVLVLLPAN